jgi:hypothetical protein
VKGIPSKKDVIKLKKENGGDLQWKVITINVDDQNNMSTSHGLGDQSNITWHGILVIDSPKAYKTTGHFAHDDHAQVWLNGKKIYDNPAWTGAVKNTKPADVEFVNGKNVLLFKCGESGGADYINLHFEKGDTALKIFPTTDDKFEEFVLPVEPQDKLPTQWGRLKRFYQ